MEVSLSFRRLENISLCFTIETTKKLRAKQFKIAYQLVESRVERRISLCPESQLTVTEEFSLSYRRLANIVRLSNKINADKKVVLLVCSPDFLYRTKSRRENSLGWWPELRKLETWSGWSTTDDLPVESCWLLFQNTDNTDKSTGRVLIYFEDKLKTNCSERNKNWAAALYIVAAAFLPA